MAEEKLNLDQIASQKQALQLAEANMLNKALTSTDVNSIMKAQTYIRGIDKREDVEMKSILIDPMDMQSSFGYKHKPFALSYEVLRSMARTNVIKAIVETRKEQISTFLEPQKDKYSTGFIIQKKKKWIGGDSTNDKISKEEESKINEIYDFILNCGNIGSSWSQDTFDVFVQKIMGDSLILDQATAEIIRDRGGRLSTFFAVDAGTIRVADSYEQDDYKRGEVEINGYTPTYVQVYMNKVLAEYYPWEMMFGVRNPSTDIRLNGYGKSELEDMIQTVTAILNADFYNSNFFKVGSAPKGILRYSGNINPNTVDDFRKQWVAQVAGVQNMHKIPMINADKLDFINTQQSNKDMEYSRYQEFLIKISCAMYKIDPSEIGFPMQGSADSKPMFEGSGAERLKYSKDKGLKPLLKKLQFWLNKYIVSQLDPNYELRFVGIDGEMTAEQELEQDIKKLSSFDTLNDVRARRDLKPLENGDIPLNPMYLQAMMMAQQGGEEANEAVEGGFGEQDEQEGKEDWGGQEEDWTERSEEDEDPFAKALENDLEKLLCE